MTLDRADDHGSDGDERGAGLEGAEMHGEIDGEIDGDDLEPITPSSAVGQFRRNTVSGAILGGVAVALRDIFDPVVREEAPIIQDWAGDPPRPRPIDVDLDPDDPTASSVMIRPHLMEPADDRGPLPETPP